MWIRNMRLISFLWLMNFQRHKQEEIFKIIFFCCGCKGRGPIWAKVERAARQRKCWCDLSSAKILCAQTKAPASAGSRGVQKYFLWRFSKFPSPPSRIRSMDGPISFLSHSNGWQKFYAVRLAFGLFEWVRPVHKYSEENEKAVKITRKVSSPC